MDDAEESDRGSENLPLVIRERDTEYQFRRVVLYKRLLQVCISKAFLIESILLRFKLRVRVNFRDIRILNVKCVMKQLKIYLRFIEGKFGPHYWM